MRTFCMSEHDLEGREPIYIFCFGIDFAKLFIQVCEICIQYYADVGMYCFCYLAITYYSHYFLCCYHDNDVFSKVFL